MIDCGTYIAGPAAAAVLGDFGAEVIKVEPPGGDPYRYLSLMPLMPRSEHLYCWILDNRNKRSIVLNLREEAGREALQRLAATADVFVTNYQPELVTRFELEYERLRKSNPRLIYAHVTGYGDRGEEANKPGYDITAYWARSGLMGFMHNADADPTISVAGFGDHPTAMALFGAILLALYRRERTGQGSKVTTSLAANGAWSAACGLQAALVGAQFPPRWSRKSTPNPLVNHYVALGGSRFLLCCLNPTKDWPNLCRALERPELVDDPRFSSYEGRTAHCVELVALLDAAFGAQDMTAWQRRFADHDILWGPVPTVQEVAGDRQLAANGVFVDLADAPLRTVSSPIQVEGVEKVPPRLAPQPGQHTAEILAELGYDQEPNPRA